LEEEVQPQIMRVDPNIAKQQVEKLNRVRAMRNQEEVQARLARLKRAAETSENLMSLI
jgi:methylmalonyl-CoA mutase N-terminal domain/subunit